MGPRVAPDGPCPYANIGETCDYYVTGPRQR
jgi:hypothetical protein